MARTALQTDGLCKGVSAYLGPGRLVFVPDECIVGDRRLKKFSSGGASVFSVVLDDVQEVSFGMRSPVKIDDWRFPEHAGREVESFGGEDDASFGMPEVEQLSKRLVVDRIVDRLELDARPETASNAVQGAPVKVRRCG